MLNKILVILVVAATAVLSVPLEDFARGISNVQNFHHHVFIQAGTAATPKNCSGSIIGTQWILTSKTCVGGDDDIIRIKIYFNALMSDQAFSIDLVNATIFKYPTLFDDIALVSIPVDLKFGKNLLSEVTFWNEPAPYAETLGFMPGVDNTAKKSLTYGIYQITDGTECEAKAGLNFDSDSQICVQPMKHVQNTLDCSQASGAGLLVGWPKTTLLVGIYSSPETCDTSEEFLGVFTNVGEYAFWINSIISGAAK